MNDVRNFLKLYVEHREAFEEKIRDSYPIIYLIRRPVTLSLRILIEFIS